jgi:hypothetical protein
MSYTSLLIESAPTVCHSPLWEWKSKDSKLNSIHTTHKKVSPKMSIYKTMDQLKAFFEKAPFWLTIKIHELSIWMVSNLGHTCPFALNLMNITMVESNSTYSSKMNVPKNCNKSEEFLWIFNPTLASLVKISLLKLKYHCNHPMVGGLQHYHRNWR